MDKNIIAIIPARGGSKGIPRKNIVEVAGKPLIAHSIEHAQKSKRISEVYVSTEDKEIAEIAGQFGAKVIQRPEELAKDDSTTLSVLKHATNHLESKGTRIDFIVCLQPTSPIRDVCDIDRAIEKIIETDCDSVVSVSEFKKKLFCIMKLEDDKLRSAVKDAKFGRRQDLETLYWVDGSIFVHDKEKMMEFNGAPFGEDVRAIVVKDKYAVDIDDNDDLEYVRYLMKNGKQ